MDRVLQLLSWPLARYHFRAVSGFVGTGVAEFSVAFSRATGQQASCAILFLVFSCLVPATPPHLWGPCHRTHGADGAGG